MWSVRELLPIGGVEEGEGTCFVIDRLKCSNG